MVDNADDSKIILKPHYVAYLDILGIKNAINSEESGVYLNKINELYKESMKMINTYNSLKGYRLNIKTKIFSDNIIIAIPKEEFFGSSINDIKSFYMVIIVAVFQIIALGYGLLIRGSLVIDNLYIDENFVYGIALSKGYELESSVANYPRVIINSRDISLFLKSDIQQNIIEKDSSNMFYVNPFKGYYDTFTPEEREIIDPKSYDEAFNHIHEILTSKLKEDNSDKVNQKICWFINLFNKYCKEKGYNQYIVDISKYPYDPYEVPTIYTGKAKELV